MPNMKIPENRKHEFVIIGSGAGGSTLGKELAARGKDVLILEKGTYEHNLGDLRALAKFYDIRRASETKRLTIEGALVYRAFMVGGTTVISCGNGIRSLEKELGENGIFLDREFVEAEREINISPLEEKFISSTSQKLKWAAEALG